MSDLVHIRRFGSFELDTAAGELRKDRRAVRLAPQAFKLLALLVIRAGDVVTRDEIRQELWGETFVDFDQGLHSLIKQVRAALGDDAERPLYVETVPRRGYRFIAPLEHAGASSALPPRTGTEARLQKALWANIAELRLATARGRRHRRLAWLVAAAILLVLAGFAVIVAW
jgi:DNA-binding winged helix-turn-helix (wHTH) protein